MPTPTNTTELSLINGSEFLEELQDIDRVIGDAAQPLADSRLPQHDNFAALDRGLPMWAAEPAAENRVYVDQPAKAFEPHDDPRPTLSAPGERRISMVAAALVIVACLTAGAATAAYVFQDSLTRISSLRSATR